MANFSPVETNGGFLTVSITVAISEGHKFKSGPGSRK